MFTVGIFTTNIPYLVFIACYAWFLLFGVEQAQEGEIQIAEKSIQIEHHLNHAKVNAERSLVFFDQAKIDFESHNNCEKPTSNQKWKVHQSLRFHAKDIIPDSLFCRPPPAMA
nr:hypothetical protein [uncultured Draconibacterium sp.]